MSVVGPIVEPIDENIASADSGAANNPGTGYDFSVNDLLFRVAPTDENPYQRATAQFQKDQLDVGHDAGDQSLTGWWTRGQFSFHKGAGTTYYDTGTTVRLNENLTVLNSYADAEGVDPFTLGKLTCQRGWDADSHSFASVSYVAPTGQGTLNVLDGTTLYTVTPGGSRATVAGTWNAVANGPTAAYAADSSGNIKSYPYAGGSADAYSGLTTVNGIWYVKSRLVVADASNGKWYQLAPNPTGGPVAVTSDDVIFTATDWAATSCVTDTPGPILIGNSNRVFALTLDGTGTVPVLSAPAQVAELPPGEIISALAHHLGFVVLVTSAGVRVGILSDNGQLTFGPLLVERTDVALAPPTTSIARYSTKASVVIDNRIYEIDLSEQVGAGLEFAYTGRGHPFTGSETAAGVTTLGVGTQVSWSESAIHYSGPTTAYMTGTLTTGLHRFATLEPKRYDSVRVTATGTSGTIAVSREDTAGVLTPLYTLDVSQDHVKEIALGLTSGEEAIGLSFELSPSVAEPDVTPVLSGYQLRALPQPLRQRMIRVPLLINDSERRQPAPMSGAPGSAWSRLSALENLETTNAIVSFRDFRTGESGRAYVESVEFNNKTPPSSQSSGFGGVGFLTLRKLS